MRIACLFDAVRVAVGAFAGAGLLLTASGCLATRAWVDDQLRPITGQQERFEIQLNNFHLEQRLVLDSSTGPTFAFGSAALTRNAKREIDQFLGDLEGSTGSGSAAPERVFVVAGYTDSVGQEDYNYELGQRRATNVADICSARRASTRRRFAWPPTARASRSPTTAHRAGGARIRRVEILVLQEKIATGS